MVFLEAEDTTRFKMYLDNVTPSESDNKHFFFFVNCERVFFQILNREYFKSLKADLVPMIIRDQYILSKYLVSVASVKKEI